jgi:hypothetical protein
MKRLFAATVATILAGTGLAAADTPPPAGAQPLSAILAIVEAAHDVAYVDEVDWDDDGYLEIELYLASGAMLDLRVDPVTGETLR